MEGKELQVKTLMGKVNFFNWIQWTTLNENMKTNGLTAWSRSISLRQQWLKGIKVGEVTGNTLIIKTFVCGQLAYFSIEKIVERS